MSTSALPSCACEICKRNKDFALPQQLLEALKSGDVVIFAGGGISTEDKTVFPYTFYEEISRELQLDAATAPDFPTVMTRFCDQSDGRQMLVRKIRERFDYIDSFPEIHGRATRFHRELSTLFQIETVITTNWDDYFEVHCGATPCVSAEDIALWKVPGRKVFKLRGSINSLGSIVATTDDYNTCYERLATGSLGSVLRTILATKTILYAGYSSIDSDFIKLHEIFTSETKGVRPHAYVITLDDRATKRFDGGDIIPIMAEGAHFVARLKEHLIADERLLPDEIFDGLGRILARVERAHLAVVSKIDLTRYPVAVFSACYHDGLIHALERIAARKKTGEYSDAHRLNRVLHEYDQMRRERLAKKLYHDVAYIDGYQNGLMWLSPQLRELLPLYYIFGAKDQPSTPSSYRKMLARAKTIHKGAYAQAQRLVRENTQGVVFHHTPFLL